MENLSKEACQAFYNRQVEQIDLETKNIRTKGDELAVVSKISVINDFMIFCLNMGICLSGKISDYEINTLPNPKKIAEPC